MKDQQARYPQLRFKGFTDPWEQRKLGDIITFINGRAYSQNELLDEGKYPVLRVGNFYTNNSWYYSNLELDSKYYATKGDLLYTWSATFGPHIWKGPKVIFHYHIWKLFFSVKVIDKEFALQFLFADREKLLNNTNGSTMIHITKKEMENKIALFPSIYEQKKIGKYLSMIDTLITANQRKVEKLKELKKGYMQKLFPQSGSKIPELRFKGFADPWEQRKLESLGTLERGKSKHRPRNDPKLFGGKIPFIQTGDISSSNLFLTKYSQTLSDFGLKQSKVWKSGTLVITIAANIADTAITTFDTTFPDSIIGFQSQKVNLVFVKAELDQQSKLIKKKADVGTQANLNLKKLSNLCFMIPNIQEQKLVANLLENINYSIAANQRKVEKLKELKKGYMQKMFC